MKDELDAQIAQERLDPGGGSHSVQDRIICSMFNRRPKSMPSLPCYLSPYYHSDRRRIVVNPLVPHVH